MRRHPRGRAAAVLLTVLVALGSSSCGWHGLNSVRLPGTAGGGPRSFEVKAQLPDVANIEENSRVRVGDVTVGTITHIEQQDWHAVLTMRLDGDVDLPANATATVGQTSLLGTVHVELAPPTDVAPQGKLRDGAMIPLSSGASYPTTEQTLAAISLLFNGGGLGQIQDINKTFVTALAGRENDLQSLIEQLAAFTGHVNDQIGDIIAATDSLNRLVGQFGEQKPVLDKAVSTLSEALAVLNKERDNLTTAADQFAQLSALTADSATQTKQALVAGLNNIGPVLESLANAGPAQTRSLNALPTLPWPKTTITNWFRGDYANATLVLDLTLSRLDSALLTGTRFEGDLTQLELQWGRTIGQVPSPYTAGNPLVVPYRLDQGP